MFEMSLGRLLLVILVAASLGAFLYLDTVFYHWDRVLPQPEEMVVETVPESSKNATTFNKPKEFVPTNEWQIINEDQLIPPGLHIQIDLQTGEKKVKLMEDNNKNNTNSLAITDSSKPKNIEDTKRSLPDNSHKFKSYEQLKDDLKDLNMTVKSDMDIMDELSKKFQEQLKLYEDSDKNLQNILTDLEYLLHQVDTAEVFVKNKGIQLIIIPCINSNSSLMKAQGAMLLGSAASNNQKVQIASLESNVIPLLLKYIDDEYMFSVQKNCIFALSSITRRFPLAQKQLIDNNGIQTFMSVFKRTTTELNTKLKLKVTQLLEDLTIEIEDAKLTFEEETNKKLSTEAAERVRQYDDLHLKDILVENGWCNILGNEFIILSNQIPLDEENHDMVEASGKSLLAMQKSCKVKLQGNKELYQSFYTLQTHYKQLLQKDVFFDELYQLTTELTNTYDPVLE
ncbi:nucleotide exchange factor SIL1 [Acyrthosiphon pisum]|uniref:Nucleotide exchange factor SIL1 n=1 Tax=Acyrthosiphon pisum TaxID=7029 RepID=A0A8R1W0U3_ACYPI|nr:nucleotide exchange factor SIL1 [Acyrthosiphon pisum]|eukprot:XP_001943966.2 PREDICTED: nucleotide exchange factor SIL1 [Acyrthosiphon pisum]